MGPSENITDIPLRSFSSASLKSLPNVACYA
jgi:hypothetical protein